MPTIIPAPRCPILGSGLFSMIRTGMPFLSKVRATISPAGPAPTYCNTLEIASHRSKINHAQLKLGEMLLEVLAKT